MIRKVAAALLASVLLGGAPAHAATAAGYAEYIIPFDEDIFAFVTQPVSSTPIGANDTTFTLISVTAWSDSVTIYYDHWENGYGYDPDDPDGPGSDEKYTLNSGQTLNFSSATVPRPRTGADGKTYVGAAGNCNAQPTPAPALFQRTTNFCYDGRDRIITIGGATSVTRGGYLNTPGVGKLAAIGEEVYPLAPQLIRYELPFGENAARNDYQRVLVVVQATEDDTTIQLDFNGDGVFDAFNTEDGYRTPRVDPVDATTLLLQRGEAYVFDRNSDGVGGTLVLQGAVVLGDKTLQVEYFYGRNSSNFDTRAVSAYPRGFWTREYYASADGGNAGVCAGGVCNTDVLLYNPNATTMTINWQTTAGSGSFDMVANETAFLQARTGNYVPDGSGVYLSGTNTFWGISDIDTNANNWDWGYSLVPSYLLSDEQTVAWAPGNSPPLACNVAGGRGNGLFVTPAYDNTTFYVDADGDGNPDTNASIQVRRGQTILAPTGTGYLANRLESLYITGSNSGTTAGSLCDLTGARIFATGPFSMSYGENPDTVSVAGGLDLGYTVLPSPANWMDLALTVEKATSPVLVSTVAGATTVTYTLVVDSHEFNIDQLSVVDTLPANWTFDNNSATIVLPDLTTISGAAANPTVALPTLTWGPGLLGDLLPNQRITITFTARTTAAFPSGAQTRNQVAAIGTRTVGGVTQTFRATDFVFNMFTDGSVNMSLTKASSVPQPIPVSPGDPLTYTVTATNPGTATANLTGVWLLDSLPVGVTSVAGSTTLSHSSVADSFSANSYANSDGTRTWATNWTETVDGGSATTGDLQVIGGELQLNNDASNEPTLTRRVNLAGATSAILNFNYRTTAGVDTTDGIQICGRRQNTDGWTCPLTAAGSFTGTAGVFSGTYSANLAVLGALTATTEIRFQFIGGGSYTSAAAAESFLVDNLSITYNVPVTGGNPADLLSSSALYTLIPGQSLTATFNVTVDNPFPSSVDEILNVATSGAAQIPIPLTASALNIVQVPGGSSATVGDRVWLDTDADGVFDAGETGLSAVEVTLKDVNGTPLQVTTTDSQGRYGFVNVAVGNGYYVEITGGLPSGLTQTTDTVGDTFAIDGLYTQNYGTLNWLTNWTEANDDGNPAAGDIRIANNRIEFLATAGNVEANDSIQRSATVTGATSIEVQYSWTNSGLDAGSDRVIVEYSPNGTTWTTLRTIDAAADQAFTDTVAWVPTNNSFFLRYRAQDPLETNELAAIDNVQVRFVKPLRTAPFNLVAAQDYVQADLGFRASPNTAAIGDLVWVDANNDQIRNLGEAGLVGITVQLFEDTNGDGLPDGPAFATAVTGPGGAYLFTGVPADGVRDWVVTVDTAQAPLTGYTATTNTLFSYANLPSSAVRVDADFGFRNLTSTFTITDGVWLDSGQPSGTANNGVKEAGELGIAGVTVDLLDSTGAVVASTVTGADGRFQFTGVPGGQNYRWRITDDADVLADFYGTTTSALSGNFQMTGDLTANLDFTAPSDLRHFGYNQTRSIGDTVWNDNGAGGGILGNGVQDGTEPGISGVTVLLYRDVDNDGVFEPGAADGAPFATEVTDAFGRYLFSGLPNGSRWFVSIDNTQAALAGFNTLTTAADYDGNAANGQQRFVTPILTGGANRLDIDYGYRTTTPSTISGRFWSDLNRNGVDNGELGLASVTVQLVNSGGTVVGTTTTAADGSYSFLGLPAGTYTVRVTDSNGVLGGYETTFERTEGALAGAYNSQETVTVGPSVTNVNFGYYRPILVTRVVVASFRAASLRGGVVVEWATASEVGTVGFDLERWDENAADYVPVNPRLLPALIAFPQGGVYRYLDEGAAPGPQRYRLVEVEASGARLAYGPYDVDALEADHEVAAAIDRDTQLLERGFSRAPHREPVAARRARGALVRAEAARAASVLGGRTRGTGVPPAFKVGVAETGLHYVGLTQDGTTVPLAQARLTNGGLPVAFTPSGDGSGILFFGRAPQSDLEADNVYRLSAEASRLRMRSRLNPNVPAPTGAETFVRRVHREQDAIAATGVYSDPESDYWVWDYVYAGFGARTFTFRADGATGTSPASLTIRLKGGTDTAADPDHHATFSLNGAPVGEAYWDGTGAYEATLEVDGALLVDGENTLVVDGLTDTAAPYSLFYVESFDVAYESAYRAYGNRLDFETAPHLSVLVTGFTRPDVLLLDVTVPNRPVIVRTPVSLMPDGTYGLVAASTRARAVFHAVAPDAVLAPTRVVRDTPSTLRQAGNRADYLVVTTAGLRETAQTLADHRSDLVAQVVDIEDVYDEFNHGVASPYALKKFLTYAQKRWRGAPRYVVLAGDGSYDYRDRLGFGDSLLPPMMANTPSGLFPSDQWFVETATASQPEIAIGRLPVATTGELAAVIAKIQAREAAQAEPWVRDTLLVADNPDEAGNYTASSEGLAGVVPLGTPLTRAYLDLLGRAAVRGTLLSAIDQGVGLVAYFGHGSYDQLADEGLLYSADVPAFVNAQRPTVITALTCLAGSSALPGYSSLGERLVRAGNGGAAAVWAPSGMSENGLAEPLARGLFDRLFEPGPARLGDAVVSARQAYKASGQPAYMLSIYNLLGDPAMRRP